MCVAVQKMAEAQMQNLGIYPPLEEPCEGEEDWDHWQREREEGEDTSPTNTAGERESSLSTGCSCHTSSTDNTVVVVVVVFKNTISLSHFNTTDTNQNKRYGEIGFLNMKVILFLLHTLLLYMQR